MNSSVLPDEVHGLTLLLQTVAATLIIYYLSCIHHLYLFIYCDIYRVYCVLNVHIQFNNLVYDRVL